jgi:hypothetical protein
MELSNTSQNVETETKQNYLVEREEIEGTPFTLYRNEDKYYVLLGMYRLNENEFSSKEDALLDAERKDWFRIMQIVGIMLENYNKNLKEI